MARLWRVFDRKAPRQPVRIRNRSRSGALLARPDCFGQELIQPDLPHGHAGGRGMRRYKTGRRSVEIGRNFKTAPVLDPGRCGAAGTPPLLGPTAGHGEDIQRGFGRQTGLRMEPFPNPGRPRIVGGSGKTEIAEPGREFGQKPRRLPDRRSRVVRIGEAAFGRGSRHELSYARGASPAGHVGAESALLPEDPRQKGGGQPVGIGCRIDHLADPFV